MSGAQAESFTNKDFLKLTDDQKSHYIFAMTDTLGFVAAYKNKEIGRCVWEWYSKSVAKANGEIITYIEEYPEKSPSMIVIALTEKECGNYVRN